MSFIAFFAFVVAVAWICWVIIGLGDEKAQVEDSDGEREEKYSGR